MNGRLFYFLIYYILTAESTPFCLNGKTNYNQRLGWLIYLLPKEKQNSITNFNLAQKLKRLSTAVKKRK
jgi:hypothetical protein